MIDSRQNPEEIKICQTLALDSVRAIVLDKKKYVVCKHFLKKSNILEHFVRKLYWKIYFTNARAFSVWTCILRNVFVRMKKYIMLSHNIISH
jgi:hypothetical protein